MTDPYTTLGTQLLAAARRLQDAPHPARRSRRPGRRLRVALVVLVLLLAGATITLAASGLLSGAAIVPQGRLSPRSGEGIPAPNGTRLLGLRAADPQGGPPWGMRIVHTTRGAVCVQIGRVRDGRLGELGTDGAFNDDGRFHALAPGVLPTDGPQNGNTFCALSGQTFTGVFTHLDRNAATSADGPAPPAAEQRQVSFGLLGPHALQITYRAGNGLGTAAVTPPAGGYLIVGRTDPRSAPQGGFATAYGSATRRRPGLWGVVSAVTYRFGDLVCSDGAGAKASARCPTPTPAPSSTINPTLSLHRPLHITLSIRHALVTGGELEFTAPYAVTSAHQDYEVVEVGGRSGCGGAVDPLDGDVRRGQTVHVRLDFPFPLASGCGRAQAYRVRYINAAGPSSTAPHESVTVGEITIVRPPGTRPAPVPRH